MIGKLTGRVEVVEADRLLLDVGGVGYLVFASGRTLSRLETGRTASLLIETHVREDHIHLYGFIDAAERDWYKLLTEVQGVGARHGLALLSALSPGELTQAIAAQDKAMLTRASGVGPKLAGRIVSELKDKIAALAPDSAGADGLALKTLSGGVSEDAVMALVTLGYRRAEAFGAVARVSGRLGQDAPIEALIKEGLKELSA